MEEQPKEDKHTKIEGNSVTSGIVPQKRPTDRIARKQSLVEVGGPQHLIELKEPNKIQEDPLKEGAVPPKSPKPQGGPESIPNQPKKEQG